MPVSFESSTMVVMGLIAALVPSAFTWLLTRAIKAVDKSIEKLGEKVDALGAEDNKIRLEITELRARIVAVEILQNKRGRK